LALCLALLRHPSGLGDAIRGARGFTPATSRQLAVIGFPASRDQETAGQSTDYDHLALARLSAEASWQVPPDTAETRCSHQAHVALPSCAVLRQGGSAALRRWPTTIKAAHTACRPVRDLPSRSAPDCPVRGHRVNGAPCRSRRMRSATPTLDPAAAPTEFGACKGRWTESGLTVPMAQAGILAGLTAGSSSPDLRMIFIPSPHTCRLLREEALTAACGLPLVNGQVRVAAGGQVKVSIPR
jgi:hypothetical protein